MSYRYQWIGNDIVFSFTGEITFDELDQANSVIYRDSRFDLMSYTIFDFTSVTRFDFNEEEMEVISALDQSIARWNKNLKLALVGSDHNNVEEMILGYLKLMRDNAWDIVYFDHLEPAMKWCLK